MDTDISTLKLTTDNQIEKMRDADERKTRSFRGHTSRSQALSNKLRRNIERIGRHEDEDRSLKLFLQIMRATATYEDQNNVDQIFSSEKNTENSYLPCTKLDDGNTIQHPPVLPFIMDRPQRKRTTISNCSRFQPFNENDYAIKTELPRKNKSTTRSPIQKSNSCDAELTKLQKEYLISENLAYSDGDDSWLRLQGQTITLSHQDHVRSVLTNSRRSASTIPQVTKNNHYQSRLTPSQSKRIHSSYTPSPSLFVDTHSRNTPKDDHFTVPVSKDEELSDEVNMEGEKLKTLVIRIPSSQSGFL